MKKKYVLLASIILTISTVFSSVAMAAALDPNAAVAENPPMRASAYIVSYTAVISKVGTATVNIDYSITAPGVMTSIGANSIVIFEKAGTTWSAVKTFSYPSTLGLRTSNSCIHTSSVQYAGVSGRQYYAVITFYSGNNSGSDTRELTTTTMTL